jgi:hypothetical protein
MCTLQTVHKEIRILKLINETFHDVSQRYFANSLRECCFKTFILICSGPGCSVGIATDYGLDSSGIESRWGRDFSHLSRPAQPVSCTMGTGSFPGVERGWGLTLTPHPF